MAISQIVSDSIAANTVSSSLIANGSILSAHVANGAITSAHITSVANTAITGVINSSQIATSAQYMGFKNRIINGNMLIWQRGTTFTNVGSSYSADRWSSSVSSNMTVSQSTDVPNVQYKYSLLVVPAVNATPAEFVIRQWIEQQNIFDFAGQTVTASAWVKCSKSSVTLRIGTQNATGGGDAVSTISVTSGTWTKISYTFTTVFSAITAWTSTPNAAGAFFDIGFVGSTALTTSDYLYITGAQVEVGPQATSFDFRAYGRELILCQRYYQKSYEPGTVPGATVTNENAIQQDWGVAPSGSVASSVFPLAVTMRTSPTLTIYDLVGNSGKVAGLDAGAATTNNTSTNTQNATSTRVYVRMYAVGFYGISYMFTVSAEL